MPTFYNVVFNQVDFDFTKSHISMKFFSFVNAWKYAKEISECADIDELHADVIDGTTGEVVATFSAGAEIYNNY